MLASSGTSLYQSRDASNVPKSNRWHPRLRETSSHRPTYPLACSSIYEWPTLSEHSTSTLPPCFQPPCPFHSANNHSPTPKPTPQWASATSKQYATKVPSHYVPSSVLPRQSPTAQASKQTATPAALNSPTP